MASLQHAVVSRIIPALRRNMSPDDIPAMRAALTRDNRMAQEGPPRDVRRTHEQTVRNVHGFPVFTLWSDGAETSSRTVLYLHGGSFVRPSNHRHWRFATRLADALDARAVLPAYPLAPEFTVEDSFEEMLGLFEDIASQSPEGVVLAGDSAGGGYALALADALATVRAAEVRFGVFRIRVGEFRIRVVRLGLGLDVLGVAGLSLVGVSVVTAGGASRRTIKQYAER